MYDPQRTRALFDEYGERELGRFEGIRGMVNLELHKRFLRRFARPGELALDAGAGPGRFTVELARLGARVHACDISAVQLDLHRAFVLREGCEDAVASRTLADVTDLSAYPDESFDLALAYGGPLSYVFERRDAALLELVRVVRPGGRIVGSVMSLLGATAMGVEGVLRVARADPGVAARVMATGDLQGDIAGTHPCHMFRASELQRFLRGFPVRLLALSASGVLCLRAGEEAARILGADRGLMDSFLDWEESASKEPGAMDLGSHILFALERL